MRFNIVHELTTVAKQLEQARKRILSLESQSGKKAKLPKHMRKFVNKGKEEA
jgi:hypothetical protein